ncbi:MAG: hypothetical protein JW783_15710 [Bacteroidales bacterium]|nr:hypothetical protein [Bacteroidales bacterium]MBN2748005.1 hypothetical protein [Bacteroidales bacterium]
MIQRCKYIIFCLLAGFASITYAQEVGVTCYTESGIGANIKLFGMAKGDIMFDMKAFVNTEAKNTLLDASFAYRFSPIEHLRVWAGAGVIMPKVDSGFEESLSLSVTGALEVTPFANFKQLSFLFVLSPYFPGESPVIIRRQFGVRYTFRK